MISLLSKHKPTFRDNGKIITRHRIREICPYTRPSPTELPSLQTLCKSEIHRKLKFTTSIPGSVVLNYTYSREASLAMPLPRTLLHSLLGTPCVIHTRSLYITPQQGESYRIYIHTLQRIYWLQRVIEISNTLRSTCISGMQGSLKPIWLYL